MADYLIKFSRDHLGPAKEIAFTARDAGPALIFAQQEAHGRSAELWRDGHRVCTLRLGGRSPGVWEIGAPAPIP